MIRFRFANANGWRLVVAMMAFLVAGCEQRSFDRGVGEEPVYFDQATPE